MSTYKNLQPEAAYFPSFKHYFWTSDSKRDHFIEYFSISAIIIFSGHDKNADGKLTSSTIVSVSYHDVKAINGMKCSNRKQIGLIIGDDTHRG